MNQEFCSYCDNQKSNEQLLKELRQIRKKLTEAERRSRRQSEEIKQLKNKIRLFDSLERECLQANLANAIEIARLGPWEYDVVNDLFTFNDHFYKMFRTTAEREGGYTMTSAEYAKRFVHPDEVHLVGDEVRMAIETCNPAYSRQLNHRIIYADGNEGCISVRFFIQKDENGRTIRTFGVNQDITEQRKCAQVLRERTEELESRNRELKELSHKTIQAMERERKTMAKELHDGIGGTLAAVLYQLQARMENVGPPPSFIEVPLEKISEYLHHAIQESRRITKQLRPPILDDFGLVAAVNELIKDFEIFYPDILILPHISVDENTISLSNDHKTVLYRILQEILNNVGKHSQAETVCVRIRRYKNWIKLKVKDNGCGFEKEKILASASPMCGFGLHSIKERAELCQGKLRITSAPGAGTSIIASIPI